MYFRLASLFICGLTAFVAAAPGALANAVSQTGNNSPTSALRVSNHHPFPIRESLRFHLPADYAKSDGNLLAVSHSVSGGTVEAHYLPIQVGSASGGQAEAWIDVQLRPSESRVYTFQEIGGRAEATKPVATVESRFPNNLPSRIELPSGRTVEFFDLLLIELPENFPTADGGTQNQIESAVETPLPLQFELKEENHGLVVSTFLFRSTSAPVNNQPIDVRYQVYASGIADVEVSLPGSETRANGPSLGLARKIPSSGSGAIRQQGQIAQVDSGDSISWFGGASWLASGDLEDGRNRAFLRNQVMVNEYLIHHDGHWLLIGAIDQPDGSLPGPRKLTYRLLPDDTRSLDQVDQAFITFAGHHERGLNDEELHVSFGRNGVEFGVSFPGPNASSPEGTKSKSEVLRDMRIANALGIEWVRIENFHSPTPASNFLTSAEGAPMLDYLESMAASARETGLKLLLSLALSPADAQLIAQRFGDVIRYYEIDTLNVSAEGIQHWRLVRSAIRSVQSDAVVFLRESSGSSGFDAIGHRVALASNEPAAPVREIALSLGGRAAASGKTPIVPEFVPHTNRRHTDEAQAQQLFRAYDHLLSQRTVPLVFHANLTPSSGVNSGNTGLLRGDGTPSVKTSAYHEIIRRYAKPGHVSKVLNIVMPVVSVRPGQTSVVTVEFTNSGSRPLEITTRPRLPEGLTSDGAEQRITLRPRQSHTIERTISASSDLAPGFYHIFEEARFDENVRMGWSYASFRGAPAADLETNMSPGVHYAGGVATLGEVNFANLRHVVFGNDAPDAEIDSALRLMDSLRQATGADIQRWSDHEFNADRGTRSHVLVGNQESNPLIAAIADSLPLDPMTLDRGEGAIMVVSHPTEARRFVLIVSGRDEAGIEKATTDLIHRYARVNDRE